MSPSWVAPCYVYCSRKFSPGLKIPLAAARQGKVWSAQGAGGDISRKFRRFPSDQKQILTKNVSPPLTPRHRQQQNVRPWCYEDLDQCIHVQVRSILSFMQSFTLIEDHNVIFFFRTHSAFSLLCNTLPQHFSHIMVVSGFQNGGSYI